MCSENKGGDQLFGYRTADLHFCFRICNSRSSHDAAHKKGGTQSSSYPAVNHYSESLPVLDRADLEPATFRTKVENFNHSTTASLLFVYCIYCSQKEGNIGDNQSRKFIRKWCAWNRNCYNAIENSALKTKMVSS